MFEIRKLYPLGPKIKEPMPSLYSLSLPFTCAMEHCDPEKILQIVFIFTPIFLLLAIKSILIVEGTK